MSKGRLRTLLDRLRASTSTSTLEEPSRDLFSLTDPFDGSLSLELETLPNDCQDPTPSMDRLSGPWGRFEIHGFLGQGGMGQVFEAFDPTLQRRIALKVLRPGLVSEAERVLKEARAQARIDHGHVAKVFETGEVEGRTYLALQFVPGGTLKEVGRSIPLEARLRLLIQACYGVHAAHAEGLLHRDLKPGNILVETREDGRQHAYVTDFGLAHDLELDKVEGAAGVLGTPMFISPEQLRMRPADPRSDVYALGVCLYWLLTGAYPFVSETSLGLLKAILDAVPIPPRTRDPRLPEDLQAICLRCLAKDVEDRYPSAKALAEDLDRWLQGLPVHAMPPTFRYRGVRWMARNPALATLGGAAAVLLLAGAATLAWSWNRVRTQARHALRFNQEVADLEMDVASVYQAPTSITRSLPKLRERLSDLERELGRSGRLAEGPGHSALGRAWIAFEDPERAEVHFREAIRRGYASPETRIGLGTVLAARFQDSQRLLLGYDPVVQAALRREARHDLADASVEQLRLAALPEPPLAVQARLLAGSGQVASALNLLEEALARQPWRQDLRRLQAESFLAAYVEGRETNRRDLSNIRFEEVLQALMESREWVRNDPFYWVKEGELRLAHAQRREAAPAELEASAAQIQDCASQALAQYPDYIPALALSAHASTVLARRQVSTSQDATQALRSAETCCRRILALRPAHGQAHALLLRVTYLRVLDWPFPPQAPDPGPFVQEGMGHYEAALQAMPSFKGILAYEAANLQEAHALWLIRNNQAQVARQAIVRGQALLPEVLSRIPDWAPAYNAKASLKQWEGRCADDPESCLQESVKDLETCIRLDPTKSAYAYNCASRYCDLAIHRLETHGEDPREFTERAVSMALEAQRLDPADDTNGALVAKARSIQMVHQLRAGEANLQGIQGLLQTLQSLRPVLRSTFIPKLWLELASAQFLRGEDPRRALEEGRKASIQSLPTPAVALRLEMQLRGCQLRHEAARGRLPAAAFKEHRARLDALNKTEFALEEVRLCLLEARQDPARREAHWARARDMVLRLQKDLLPESGETRLLAAGLEAEIARARGQLPSGPALAELRLLARPGSGRRLEAEAFLQGRWR